MVWVCRQLLPQYAGNAPASKVCRTTGKTDRIATPTPGSVIVTTSPTSDQGEPTDEGAQSRQEKRMNSKRLMRLMAGDLPDRAQRLLAREQRRLERPKVAYHATLPLLHPTLQR